MVKTARLHTNVFRFSSGMIAVTLLLLCFVSNLTAAEIKLKNIRHLYDIKTAGNKAIALPTDVVVDKDKVYVVDGTNSRIAVFTGTGKFLYTIGEGETAGLLKYPVGMTVSRDRMYIADTANHAVRIMDLDGKLISTIKIKSNGKDERPIDVVVSSDDKELFVTCNNTQKIQVYDMQGKLLREWGTKGEKDGNFRYPATIQQLGKKQIIVVDVLNARAQIFTNKGRFLRAIGGLGVDAGKLFRPKGVAVDEKGKIYISDSYMDVIQVFDDTGHLLYVLGNRNKMIRFVAPAGIAVYDGRLYVAEVLGHKVSVYSLK